MASTAPALPDEPGSNSDRHHAHAHDHHGHGDGADGHGHHDTNPETAPEPPCVVLAAFAQNPDFFANPAVHSMDRPALAFSFGSVSATPRVARVQTHHSRAPPHLI